MSRTDKDAPWRVRADWFKPSHHTHCPYFTLGKWQRWGQERPCDLPAAQSALEAGWLHLGADQMGSAVLHLATPVRRPARVLVGT